MGKRSGQGLPLGFDFSILPHAVGLGAFDFARHLFEAEVVAVLFGFQNPDRGNPIPIISLAARNRDPLIAAFAQFNSWADNSSGDALDITVVYLTNGGYLFTVGPELTNLEQRCFGFDTVHRRINLAISSTKRLDTVSPDLRGWERYCRRLISPFYFYGVEYLGTEGTPPSHRDFRPIGEIKPLLKFRASFFAEEDATEGSEAWLALQSDRERPGDREPTSPGDDPQSDYEHRLRMMDTHFPVTLARARNHGFYKGRTQALLKEGVAEWQIQQALCNAVLSRVLTEGRVHFAGLPAANLTDMIGEQLTNRYEFADGTSLPDIDSSELVRQVVLDSRALLRHHGVLRPPTAIPAIQRSLRDKGLMPPFASH